MKRLLLLCGLLCAALSNAQMLKGTITDAATGEPLPYVNIGVLNKNIGTVSTEEGEFAFAVPAGHLSDTVRISMIGYGTRDVVVSKLRDELLASPVIKMKEEQVELPQVVVSNKKAKQKLLGNKTESQSTTVGFKDNRLGYEIGMIMRIKGKSARLKTFTASVASTNNPNVKLRLNFYSVDKGKPGKLIIDENIFVKAPTDNGKLDRSNKKSFGIRIFWSPIK